MEKTRPSGYFDAESNRLIGEVPTAAQVSRQRRMVAQAGGQPALMNEQDLDRQLGRLQSYLASQAQTLLSRARSSPSADVVNALIDLSKEAEALEDDELADYLFFKAREAAARVCESAERAFRAFPSSENYAKWWGMIKMCHTVGAEPASQMPTVRLKGWRIHVVAGGETLSKLARHYYGSENLWDVIYEENSLHFHPDWIRPGQRLIIP